MANAIQFAKFAKVFPRQNFALYSSCFVVVGKYNDYLRVSGGVVGNVTCNRAVKSTDVHYISKDTLLIHLVSLENANKNDWLYIVLMDVVSWLIVALLL